MTSDIYTRLQSAFAAAIESGEINTYSRMTRGNEVPDESGDLYWTDDPAGPLVAFDCVFHRREERRELPASVWVILTDSGAVLHSESSGDDIGGPLLSYTYRLASYTVSLYQSNGDHVADLLETFDPAEAQAFAQSTHRRDSAHPDFRGRVWRVKEARGGEYFRDVVKFPA